MTTVRIRIRRGTQAQILAVTNAADGEPFYSTDTEKLFIADETGVPQPAGVVATFPNGVVIPDGVPGDTNDALYNDGDVLKWQGEVIPMAGTPYSYWDPDLLPVSPTSQDDEFDTPGAIDGKWTTVNWGSASATPDVDTTIPNALYIPTSGATPFICALQPIPAGDFTIITKCRAVQVSSGPSTHIGLILANGTTPGAGSQTQLIIGGSYGSQEGWSGAYSASNFTTTGSLIGTGYNQAAMYGRIRRSGTTYYFGWSPDGKVWAEVSTTLGYTPSHFGIHLNTETADTFFGEFDFFRYEATATPSATKGGVRTIGASGGYTALNKAGDAMLGILATAGAAGGLAVPPGVPGSTANTIYSTGGVLFWDGEPVGASDALPSAAPASEALVQDRPNSAINALRAMAYNPATALLSARSFL